MKTKLVFLLAFLLCSVMMPAQAADEAPYRHVVLFKFKDTASKADIQKVEKAFAELKEKVTTIQDFEWGTNVSPETHSQGFTHCFLVTFKNKADLEAYLPHPEHKKFGAILGPHLDKVLVIDYVAQKSAE